MVAYVDLVVVRGRIVSLGTLLCWPPTALSWCGRGEGRPPVAAVGPSLWHADGTAAACRAGRGAGLPCRRIMSVEPNPWRDDLSWSSG
jgi:hypothetical protein